MRAHSGSCQCLLASGRDGPLKFPPAARLTDRAPSTCRSSSPVSLIVRNRPDYRCKDDCSGANPLGQTAQEDCFRVARATKQPRRAPLGSGCRWLAEPGEQLAATPPPPSLAAQIWRDWYCVGQGGKHSNLYGID